MSTHPEVVTLDPASNDDALRLAAAIRSVCDIDGRWDAAEILQALAAESLPEEPPEHSVVRAGSFRLYRDDIDPAGTPYRCVWFVMYGPDYTAEWMTWPEVCALGTPEVLEPDSVKALRETVEFLANQRDRFRTALDQTRTQRDKARATVEALRGERVYFPEPATEDEPAEPAPVEVTEEPEPNGRVRTPNGDVWRRLEGCRDWHNDTFPRGECESWNQLRERGPLTLVETGGQS
jgi:hypothetical protein